MVEVDRGAWAKHEHKIYLITEYKMFAREFHHVRDVRASDFVVVAHAEYSAAAAFVGQRVEWQC